MNPVNGHVKLLKSVQAGRGVAALAVVFYHCSLKIFEPSKYWHSQIFHGFFNFGHAGVEFFFVLSGFIVAHVHARDIGNKARLAPYIERRLIRVYPVLWVVVSGVMILSILPLGFDSSGALTVKKILASYLLVGDDSHGTVLAVAWTLFHEVIFYGVFGLWIVSPRLGALASSLWLAVIVVGALGAPVAPAYLGNPINLLFPMGVAAWWMADRHPEYLPSWLAVVAAGALVVFGIEDVYGETLSDTQLHLCFGAASATLLAAMVATERRTPIQVPLWLMTLGAASYSIYLTHFPVLGAIAQVARWTSITRAIPAPVSFFVVVGLATLAGVAFHYLIEKPIIGQVNAAVRTRRLIAVAA